MNLDNNVPENLKNFLPRALYAEDFFGRHRSKKKILVFLQRALKKEQRAMVNLFLQQPLNTSC